MRKGQANHMCYKEGIIPDSKRIFSCFLLKEIVKERSAKLTKQ